MDRSGSDTVASGRRADSGRASSPSAESPDILKLDRSVGLWIESALSEPGVALLHLHPQIVVESTQLPQPFHRHPADQLLVATARVLQCPIMTDDSKIAAYPHVRIA